MVATDLDLLVHYAIRLYMRDGGLSADEAFDAALTTLLDLAQDIDGAEELVVYCTLLSKFRESILPEAYVQGEGVSSYVLGVMQGSHDFQRLVAARWYRR